MMNIKTEDARLYYSQTNIAFKVLKNRIYLLTWVQYNASRQKLLTKASAIKFANDLQQPKPLRDAVIKAFEEGIIV